jgi:hypothetical protein
MAKTKTTEKPPVCPHDQTALTYDVHRVRCENDHEFGPHGWGYDFESDLSHLSIEELCRLHREVADSDEEISKVVFGGMVK